MSKSPNRPETTYSAIIFDTGETEGHMFMHDVTYTPDAVAATLQEHFGPEARTIAVLQGLTEAQISTLGVIFNRVNDMGIRTKEDLEKLLRFSSPTIEPAAVRETLQSLIPQMVRDMLGNMRFLAIMERLFALYLALGDNPAAFERAAEKETAQMQPADRATCLSTFHIILREVQPQIKRMLSERN